MLGMSFGCPVMYAANVGAWRSCGSCDDPAIAGANLTEQGPFGPDNAVLSGDGMFVAVAGAYDGPGIALWRLRPDPAALLVIPRRTEEARWNPQEYPVAITPGGGRILTGARTTLPCYLGPGFEIRVRDGGTGVMIVDSLPPGLPSVDAAVRTIAYGPQLWCAQ
jgi:hypothetical protein